MLAHHADRHVVTEMPKMWVLQPNPGLWLSYSMCAHALTQSAIWLHTHKVLQHSGFLLFTHKCPQLIVPCAPVHSLFVVMYIATVNDNQFYS